MANLLNRYESESYPGQFCVVAEDHVEDGSKYGWGRSLEEARAAWGELIVEHVDDYLYDLHQAGAIDDLTATESFVSIDGIAWLPF